MTTYIPVIIWLFSAVICVRIARQRLIKPTTFWAALVALLGPFAIRLLLLQSQRKTSRNAAAPFK